MSNHEFDNEEALWEALPDQEGRERAHLLIHIAGFRYHEDDYATGLAVSQEAASLYEAAGDLRGAGLALQEVARGLNGTCEHGEAIATLQRSIELLSKQIGRAHV